MHSFLGVRGRELDDKWDDNGAGACLFLEQEMSDAMTGAASPAEAYLQPGVRNPRMRSACPTLF